MYRYLRVFSAFCLLFSVAVNAAPNIPAPTKNHNIPTRSSCGFQVTSKIFDGEQILLEQFPWVVLLQYTLPSGKTRFSCSGSLISPRYVLTAAHCVSGIPSSAGKLTSVRLGEYNTATDVDCNGTDNCNEKPVDVEVEEITAHKDYNKGDRSNHNDLALIRLKTIVPYSKYISPVCLPEQNESTAANEPVILVKWERTTDATIKKQVKLPVVEKEQCQKVFSGLVNLTDTQLCAGGQLGKDACNGDGGGPLLQTTRNDPSQWYQEGIVSFGAQPCGKEGYPSVYTRIAAYLPWIHETVRD